MYRAPAQSTWYSIVGPFRLFALAVISFSIAVVCDQTIVTGKVKSITFASFVILVCYSLVRNSIRSRGKIWISFATLAISQLLLVAIAPNDRDYAATILIPFVFLEIAMFFMINSYVWKKEIR